MTKFNTNKLREIAEPKKLSPAEERALEAYPNEHFVDYTYAEMCRGFYEEGYEQAEKDIIAIVKEYVEKGLRCMEQSDKFQVHTFWDGFHNCAENILREMEDKE